MRPKFHRRFFANSARNFLCAARNPNASLRGIVAMAISSLPRSSSVIPLRMAKWPTATAISSAILWLASACVNVGSLVSALLAAIAMQISPRDCSAFHLGNMLLASAMRAAPRKPPTNAKSSGVLSLESFSNETTLLSHAMARRMHSNTVVSHASSVAMAMARSGESSVTELKRNNSTAACCSSFNERAAAAARLHQIAGTPSAPAFNLPDAIPCRVAISASVFACCAKKLLIKDSAGGIIARMSACEFLGSVSIVASAAFHRFNAASLFGSRKQAADSLYNPASGRAVL